MFNINPYKFRRKSNFGLNKYFLKQSISYNNMKISNPKDQIKITNPNLKELYNYFTTQRAYALDELAHLSSDIVGENLEKINGFIKNIENIQTTINDLYKDSEWLRCLEQAGVDNWSGYDIAIDIQDGKY